jgi:hypothetical protein
MKKLLLAAIILATLLLSGCGTTRIARILNDPMRYSRRTVRVEGTVTNVVGALVAGVYQVDDGTRPHLRAIQPRHSRQRYARPGRRQRHAGD